MAGQGFRFRDGVRSVSSYRSGPATAGKGVVGPPYPILHLDPQIARDPSITPPLPPVPRETRRGRRFLHAPVTLCNTGPPRSGGDGDPEVAAMRGDDDPTAPPTDAEPNGSSSSATSKPLPSWVSSAAELMGDTARRSGLREVHLNTYARQSFVP